MSRAKAIENIAKIFASRRALGKQAGETAAILVRDYVIIEGVKHILQKVNDIFIDGNGNTNEQGIGEKVATTYQSNTGEYIQVTVDGRTFILRGNQWVQT